MIKTVLLAATAVSMVAIPTAASAQSRYYGQNYGYHQGYSQGYYPQQYYGQQQYGQRYYGQRGYNQRYDTVFLDLGSVHEPAHDLLAQAGALLGREIGRSGSRDYYGYRRGGNNGTLGAIIGGAVGAIAGREVTRTC